MWVTNCEWSTWSNFGMWPWRGWKYRMQWTLCCRKETCRCVNMMQTPNDQQMRRGAVRCDLRGCSSQTSTQTKHMSFLALEVSFIRRIKWCCALNINWKYGQMSFTSRHLKKLKAKGQIWICLSGLWHSHLKHLKIIKSNKIGASFFFL